MKEKFYFCFCFTTLTLEKDIEDTLEPSACFQLHLLKSTSGSMQTEPPSAIRAQYLSLTAPKESSPSETSASASPLYTNRCIRMKTLASSDCLRFFLVGKCNWVSTNFYWETISRPAKVCTGAALT